jgi:FPC/CPF motif-containing protein YcgG
MSSATQVAPPVVLGDQPAWGADALQRFRDELEAPDTPFPCTFAVAALRQEHLRFAFVDSAGDSMTWEPLPELLARYVETSQSIARITSLVVFFHLEDRSRRLDWYEERFWSVLGYLHARDPQPWPAELPCEPEHPRWEFAFAGQPIFVVCSTPAHRRRRSRWSPEMTITFQPRSVFQGLEAETPRGQSARRGIRQRLSRYDAPLEPSPLLASYGEVGNREWRQYFLGETNRPVVRGRCPLRVRLPSPLVTP